MAKSVHLEGAPLLEGVRSSGGGEQKLDGPVTFEQLIELLWLPEHRAPKLLPLDVRKGQVSEAGLARLAKGLRPEDRYYLRRLLADEATSLAPSVRAALESLLPAAGVEPGAAHDATGRAADNRPGQRVASTLSPGSLLHLRSGGLEQTRNAPGPPYGSPEFDAALDAATGSRVHPNNRVGLLFDGLRAFREREKLIAGAQHSINLQTFIFQNDRAGWRLARLLAQKAREGVKVRVIVDAVGSMGAGPLLAMMREAGVDVREHAPISQAPLKINKRWHEKILVVDGAHAVTGGMNVAEEYAFAGTLKRVARGGAAWRDVDVRLTGGSVRALQTVFVNNWARLGEPIPPDEADLHYPTQPVVTGGPGVRIVHHRPTESDERRTEELYLHAIRSATETITIENAYFIPTDELRTALIEAAQRGVKVRILTNSRGSTDVGLVADAARSLYREMLAAGIEIFEARGRTLHAKTASFDGEYAIVASVNLNRRSAYHDAEIAVATRDPMTAQALDERFETGVRWAEEVTLETPRGLFAHVRQWAASCVANVF